MHGASMDRRMRLCTMASFGATKMLRRRTVCEHMLVRQ